uniref:Uncharacterized protein n=1 Tax=Cannabis sativa TaxID=3483 RepID=A0A803NKJ1_CANSA
MLAKPHRTKGGVSSWLSQEHQKGRTLQKRPKDNATKDIRLSPSTKEVARRPKTSRPKAKERCHLPTKKAETLPSNGVLNGESARTREAHPFRKNPSPPSISTTLRKLTTSHCVPEPRCLKKKTHGTLRSEEKRKKNNAPKPKLSPKKGHRNSPSPKTKRR